MLTKAVDSYIAMRRACGFAFQSEGTCLRSFAAFSDAKGHYQVRSDIAVEWVRCASEPAGSVSLFDSLGTCGRKIRAMNCQLLSWVLRTFPGRFRTFSPGKTFAG